jgi:hypothetical protein
MTYILLGTIIIIQFIIIIYMKKKIKKGEVNNGS